MNIEPYDPRIRCLAWSSRGPHIPSGEPPDWRVTHTHLAVRCSRGYAFEAIRRVANDIVRQARDQGALWAAVKVQRGEYPHLTVLARWADSPRTVRWDVTLPEHAEP
jgi:hypothetical protein